MNSVAEKLETLITMINLDENTRAELVQCYYMITDVISEERINAWIESLNEEQIKHVLEWKRSNPHSINDIIWDENELAAILKM